MTEYIRTEKNGGTLLSAENNASSPILTIMTAEEFAERKNEFLHVKDVLHGKGAARYCKADVFANCIWGTVRIPNKSDDTKPPVSFLFYLVDNKLVLIEDVGNIKQWIKVQSEKLCDFNSSDTLLFRIIESSFENDLMYLSHIEKKIETLEDSISENLPNDFFDKITKERNLSMFIFNIQETQGRTFTTHTEGYEYLNSNGVKVIENFQKCTHFTNRYPICPIYSGHAAKHK